MNVVSGLSFILQTCVKRFHFQQHIKRLYLCPFPYNRSYEHRLCSKAVSKVRNETFSVHDINTLQLTDLITNAEKVTPIIAEIQDAAVKRKRCPQYMTCEQLQKLCELETRTQRFGYLSYLFKREKRRIADAVKKEKKKIERELKLHESSKHSNNNATDYSSKNILLVFTRAKSWKTFYKRRLANAALFGEKIVLDLGYDSYMTEKEKSACINQLKHIYSANRENRDPYDLHFCNAEPSYYCVQNLQKHIHKLSESFITLTEKSYLDYFPKEKLVYLSPHATETLKEYDHNAIYIIGAFVDTVKREHHSLHKADQEEIKSVSLPLDEYIMWGAGTKSLTVNQVFEIMLAMKNGSSWKEAFTQVIPTRKIRKLNKEQIDNVPDKIFLIKS
ncbi:tRNA methyltransferase 10 homolog C [Caerostris extrusa]|uniref:RNA (guanine-9-)-methyltransferase domain-containing protein 1 n=1 Tax=Caerostris extrusa TaxID=172846 RepID=A0AAV4VUE5_CAEEX|nr:tRNA methyltransferase 10 homolog C [Caerostris extrusa]